MTEGEKQIVGYLSNIEYLNIKKGPYIQTNNGKSFVEIRATIELERISELEQALQASPFKPVFGDRLAWKGMKKIMFGNKPGDDVRLYIHEDHERDF